MFSYFVFAPPMPMPMVQFQQPYGFGINAYSPRAHAFDAYGGYAQNGYGFGGYGPNGSGFNAYGSGQRTSPMTCARNESSWTASRLTTCDAGPQSGLSSRSGTNPDESTAGRIPFEQWIEKSASMFGKLELLLTKLGAATGSGAADANGTGSGSAAAVAYCQSPQNMDNWQYTGAGPVV
jgi:hypothetical protein